MKMTQKMLILVEKNKKIHDAIEIQYKIKGKSIAGISENNLHLKEQRKILSNLNMNPQKIYLNDYSIFN